MYQYKKITEDMFWIGGNDRRLSLFESIYPVPDGVSYNSYFIDDDKTIVLDTVDKSISHIYFENLTALLGNRKLDYLLVNHMEPDHSAMIGELLFFYPDVKIVCNQKAKDLIEQFFDDVDDKNYMVVSEGDTLNTGKHTFTFVMAPMVHWHEVMVTYDKTDKILFSADAFGTFGALSGNIFADEIDFEHTGLDEARRYYTNIVGKYGVQVQALLKKASDLDISMICPLHGPVFRKNINWLIDKYYLWSSYTPECNDVLIAYASIYGNTENAVYILANALSDYGIKVHMYDTSAVHSSYIVAQAFKCSHLIFASPTYNAGIFSSMEALLLDLKAHNLQNRTVALIENGSWGPASGNLMMSIISSMKNMNILDDVITIKSNLKLKQRNNIEKIADIIYNSMPKSEVQEDSNVIEPDAMFKLTYGLFVITAKDSNRDNGCIINSVTQITDNPKRISLSINKLNLTRDMICDTGVFNLSILSTDADFSVFKQFGFSSGRETDKFKDIEYFDRTENGLTYITKYSNAVLSAKVFKTIDIGTHTVFMADVTAAKSLSSIPSMTYQYYLNDVKPKPQPTTEIKKGYVCKICGYIYEGDNLPDDFICPWCKHGAEDFEPIGQ